MNWIKNYIQIHTLLNTLLYSNFVHDFCSLLSLRLTQIHHDIGSEILLEIIPH